MFNDPTFLGWFTTGMYVAAAVLCACAARSPVARLSVHRSVEKRLKFFWILLAAGLAALSINKQLDLQTFLTDLLRNDAERRGWYQQRHVLQIAFVVGAVVAGVFALWLLHRLLGRQWRVHRMALGGLAVLMVYLLLRVADIERLGEMLRLPLAAHWLSALLEWAGLLMIAVAAWRRAVGM